MLVRQHSINSSLHQRPINHVSLSIYAAASPSPPAVTPPSQYK